MEPAIGLGDDEVELSVGAVGIDLVDVAPSRPPS
jgi:hypothetical protein